MISLPENLGSMDGTCPMYLLLDMLGKKWMLLIIIILFKGKQSFNSLTKQLSPISGKTLTERLDLLLEQKYIKREVSDKKPIKVTYELTLEGRELAEQIIKLGLWKRESIKKIVTKK